MITLYVQDGVPLRPRRAGLSARSLQPSGESSQQRRLTPLGDIGGALGAVGLDLDKVRVDVGGCVMWVW